MVAFPSFPPTPTRLGTGRRAGNLEQVGRHHSPAHPALHPRFPMLPAAPQPKPPLQHTDPSLRPRPARLAPVHDWGVLLEEAPPLLGGGHRLSSDHPPPRLLDPPFRPPHERLQRLPPLRGTCFLLLLQRRAHLPRLPHARTRH